MVYYDTLKTSSVLGTITTEHSSSKTDRYSLLSLPITVTGTIYNKGKFIVSATMGMQVNLLLKGVTYIRNTANTDLIAISTLLSKFSLSYRAALGIEYKLTTKCSLLAQPVVNFNISSVHSKAAPISQKPYSYGINLGVRVNF